MPPVRLLDAFYLSLLKFSTMAIFSGNRSYNLIRAPLPHPHRHDSIVGSLPQLNSVDCDYFSLLINLVKHPVFSFSDPVPIPPSSQLRNTLRKGGIYQTLNVSIDSDICLIIESIEILLCALLDPDLIHLVSTCAFYSPHNPSFLRFSTLQNP
nr:hypothetical protein GZ27A8_8 [uncultured archaeon GZfos27A8]